MQPVDDSTSGPRPGMNATHFSDPNMGQVGPPGHFLPPLSTSLKRTRVDFNGAGSPHAYAHQPLHHHQMAQMPDMTGLVNEAPHDRQMAGLHDYSAPAMLPGTLPLGTSFQPAGAHIHEDLQIPQAMSASVPLPPASDVHHHANMGLPLPYAHHHPFHYTGMGEAPMNDSQPQGHPQVHPGVHNGGHYGMDAMQAAAIPGPAGGTTELHGGGGGGEPALPSAPGTVLTAPIVETPGAGPWSTSYKRQKTNTDEDKAKNQNRNTSGVPEWSPAEVEAVMAIYRERGNLPKWKPIADELKTRNATGQLNRALSDKGLSRSNNAVMNKVKEMLFKESGGAEAPPDLTALTTERHRHRSTSGVPEWNEAEVQAVMALWAQHDKRPDWKPISIKLAAANSNGELNAELHAKGLIRTNNAVMNKVKELSGISPARRSRTRTSGTYTAKQQLLQQQLQQQQQHSQQLPQEQQQHQQQQQGGAPAQSQPGLPDAYKHAGAAAGATQVPDANSNRSGVHGDTHDHGGGNGDKANEMHPNSFDALLAAAEEVANRSEPAPGAVVDGVPSGSLDGYGAGYGGDLDSMKLDSRSPSRQRSSAAAAARDYKRGALSKTHAGIRIVGPVMPAAPAVVEQVTKARTRRMVHVPVPEISPVLPAGGVLALPAVVQMDAVLIGRA